jgi:hypothetical protein
MIDDEIAFWALADRIVFYYHLCLGFVFFLLNSMSNEIRD